MVTVRLARRRDVAAVAALLALAQGDGVRRLACLSTLAAVPFDAAPFDAAPGLVAPGQ